MTTDKVLCRNCNKLVPKGKEYIRKDNSISKCKVCNWLNKHNYPKYDNFSDEEVFDTLHFLIYDESVYYNDLSNILNRSIEDIINLQHMMKIGLRREHFIKTTCKCCGKEILSKPQVYLKNNNNYCSNECYWKDKPNTILKGENSPWYNRIDLVCTNCGKKMKIIPSRCTKNSYGDINIYCSRKCYAEYRSKYYIGEKCGMTNYKFSDDQINRIRIRMANQALNKPQLNTKIQLKINDLLTDLNINYQREKNYKFYTVDNYLSDYNLIIEIMGDYWHCNPFIYNSNSYKINDIQRKDIKKDKSKHTYIKKYYGINILYLWESDINNNFDLCKELILHYINSNGILSDYQSFNYNFYENNLNLNNKIIYPYFLLSVNDIPK